MRRRARAVTLLELMIVVAILGLLATLAFSVYSTHILRAKFAAAALQISELETACNTYQLDVGQYPISSSGTQLAPPGPIDPMNNPGTGAQGCGYMITCLVASLSGDIHNVSDLRWNGPYIELNQSRIGTLTGPLDPTQPAPPMPSLQLLDPWGNPYQYVRSSDYETFGGTRLPPNSPFATEIWFNPSTIQIVSFGPNGVSGTRPAMGLEPDDVSNLRY